MPWRRCPHCRKLVIDREFLAHRQAHWDRARERKGSSGNWKTLRGKVIARDRYRCRKCGAAEELEVHHVDGDWRNNDLGNLITLCNSCHPRRVG